MNRVQRKKFVLGVGLAIAGVAIAIGGPMLVMLVFVAGGSFDQFATDDLDGMQQSFETIFRINKIVLILQLFGLFTFAFGVLYALTVTAMWFIGEGESGGTNQSPVEGDCEPSRETRRQRRRREAAVD